MGIIATGLIVIICSSCASTISLTKEQNNKAAEYIAGTLLKYDSSYESKLLLVETQTEMPTERPNQTQEPIIGTPEPTQQGTGEKTNNNPKEDGVEANIELSELFSKNNIKLEYNSYSINDIYIEKSSGVPINPKKNEQLVIVKFKVTNLSSKEENIDLALEGITYKLVLNGKSTVKPLLTIALNDIQNFEKKLKSKKSEILSLIFSVSKTDIDELKVVASKNDKNAVVTLK